MQTADKFDTLAKRAKWAREKNKWNQSELARRLRIKAQTIQSIESGRTKKSRLVLEIATECSVDPHWLATGLGSPEKLGAREERPSYLEKLSADAIDLARAYDGLPRSRQNIVREYIWIENIIAKRMPWLIRGKPSGTRYEDWERDVMRDFKRVGVTEDEKQ